MKFSPLKIAASLAILATSATFAQTKAPEPDYTLSYNVGAVSDYRFRGISQTSFKPALQVGVDFVHKSGFYLGAFGSNVDWVKQVNGATKGSYEIDLYGGFKGNVTKDIGFDVGLITYQYPGNNSGVANVPKGIVAGQYSNANTNELYLGLSYNVVSFKYSRSMGDFLGNVRSGGSQYFDFSANFDLGNGFTLTPHIGRQTVPNQNFGGSVDGKAANYTDYALTLGKDFGNGFSGSAALIGTNTRKPGFYRDSNGKDLGRSNL
ncbi:MAG: hypothetical protein H7197_13405, partial [Vitreoscilla sp.]|nr:hypothetical protein [Polaromonas sp.]